MKLIHVFSILAVLALTSCVEKKEAEDKISYKKYSIANKSVGISFFDISLDEALLKAEKENKLVFIDCSTTTCGPCRMMRRSVFTKKECGDFINTNFVPLHMNMDEGAGADVGEKYGISMYPTYLILNTDGSKRGELMGAEKNVRQFIEKVREAARL